MAYSDQIRTRAVQLYEEEALSPPRIIETLLEEYEELAVRYPAEDTIRRWVARSRGVIPKPKAEMKVKPRPAWVDGNLQRDIRRSFGPQFLEEATDAYSKLLTTYIVQIHSIGFTPHQPLYGAGPKAEFRTKYQEFFHSLALEDGDFDALEKELEQAHHSGNQEWAWQVRQRLVEHLRGYCRPRSVTRTRD